jgi:hypothetical protein
MRMLALNKIATRVAEPAKLLIGPGDPNANSE